TSAPARASASDEARPMPEAPPVTSATRFESSPISGGCLQAGMGEVPIELACPAEGRARLKIAAVDLHDWLHLAEITGGEDLVRLLEIAIDECRFEHRHTRLAQELDHALARDAVEEGAVGRGRHHHAVPGHEDVRGRRLGDIAEEVRNESIGEAAAPG